MKGVDLAKKEPGPLETATDNELLKELVKRFDVFILGGAKVQTFDKTQITAFWHGPEEMIDAIWEFVGARIEADDGDEEDEESSRS